MRDQLARPLPTRQGAKEVLDCRHQILHQVGGSGANGADHELGDHLIPQKVHH